MQSKSRFHQLLQRFKTLFGENNKSVPQETSPILLPLAEELVGATIGTTYKIESFLGQGGMGKVYLAEQLSIPRKVAIKFLLGNDDLALERFKREAEMISKSESPHILPIYDFGYWRGIPYIVMRYVPGGTLSDLMARKENRLGVLQSFAILEQIAKALDLAHANGVIHRDLKPANVFLDESSNVYLADFGLAKPMESPIDLTKTNVIVGTPAYLSPEQAKGQKVGRETDVYSLGVIAFQIFSGRLPFQADTPLAMAFAHISEPPPSIKTIVHDMPDGVAIAISNALAKEPNQRPKSAGDFIAQLRKAFGEYAHLDRDKLTASSATLVQSEDTGINQHQSHSKIILLDEGEKSLKNLNLKDTSVELKTASDNARNDSVTKIQVGTFNLPEMEGTEFMPLNQKTRERATSKESFKLKGLSIIVLFACMLFLTVLILLFNFMINANNGSGYMSSGLLVYTTKPSVYVNDEQTRIFPTATTHLVVDALTHRATPTLTEVPTFTLTPTVTKTPTRTPAPTPTSTLTPTVIFSGNVFPAVTITLKVPIGCVTYNGGHEIQFEFIWKGFIESNKGRQLQIRIFREDDQYGDPVYTQTIGEAQRKTDGSNLWTYRVPVGISENEYGFYQNNPQTNDYMWDIVYINASGLPIESSGYQKGCFHYIPNNSPLAPNKVDADN